MTVLRKLCNDVRASLRRSSNHSHKQPTLLPEFVRFFFSTSKGSHVMAVLAGSAAGASSTVIVFIINQILVGSAWPFWALATAFATACIGRVVFSVLANFQMSYLHQEIVTRFNTSLCRQILEAPLRDIERIGQPRLLVALSEDVTAVSDAVYQMPSFCIHTTALIGCLLYLTWVSSGIALVVLLFTVGGVSVHRALTRAALSNLTKARRLQDKLHTSYKVVSRSPSELKLHRVRREAFLTEQVNPVAIALAESRVLGRALYSVATAWGGLLAYLVIGSLFLWMHAFGIGHDLVTVAVLTILQLLGAISGLSSSLPAFANASVALRALRSIGLALHTELPAESKEIHAATPAWSRIELDGVSHQYDGDSECAGFRLGPLNLTVEPGEIIFIAGGNGAGKTTLTKLIAGLYTPSQGEIRFDGQPVTDCNRERYRQHFSAVFSDFSLFPTLIGIDAPDRHSRAEALLRTLWIDHKVTLHSDQFSTIDLSAGQQKRLALLVALLEDRPIYIFDEWAADQDAAFRDKFYSEILPAMKRCGKTVLVITHDDRYFHTADRLLRLDYGTLLPVKTDDDAKAAVPALAAAAVPHALH